MNVIYTFRGVLISVCNIWIIPDHIYIFIHLYYRISIYMYASSVCNIRILSWCMYIYTCIQYLYMIYNNPGVDRIWKIILPKSWQNGNIFEKSYSIDFRMILYVEQQFMQRTVQSKVMPSSAENNTWGVLASTGFLQLLPNWAPGWHFMRLYR